jgi:hypothetical protein
VFTHVQLKSAGNACRKAGYMHQRTGGLLGTTRFLMQCRPHGGPVTNWVKCWQLVTRHTGTWHCLLSNDLWKLCTNAAAATKPGARAEEGAPVYMCTLRLLQQPAKSNTALSATPTRAVSCGPATNRPMGRILQHTPAGAKPHLATVQMARQPGGLCHGAGCVPAYLCAAANLPQGLYTRAQLRTQR